MNYNTPSEGFNKLYDIIKQLRSPDGCPWDRKQTPDSIKENIIEEAYECIDAIIEDDTSHVCEELGDLYLLATFTSIMYEEDGKFSIDAVFKGISDKLIRRHPHVFADAVADSSEEVVHQWEEIKQNVEGRVHDNSVLDSVPKHFPPLLKAQKLQKKAVKSGFDWNQIDDVILKLDEEIHEFKEAVAAEDKSEIEAELGDILFTIVNIARFLSVDPSTALSKTNTKFTNRFQYIEQKIKQSNQVMKETPLEKLEELWQEAKLQKEPD
ncbi:MAG: nucleoside triphosphate pyrophosphohydrolase [Spirochaetales bacterium]|uniref:Nucleoside triphosphate pyrophosphohydrolase n=1 Tax=Candidatus Thalassospirochaeta sargassi TaxID=3119039 RepID=A0AAJ1IDL0_9SPIO|nr:nucleoside triphosphate pyrophosphohydrolase [Spirochaetales bacterium]